MMMLRYDKACNVTVHQKLESSQCDAFFAIAGEIKCGSKEKLYQELGLESSQSRC